MLLFAILGFSREFVRTGCAGTATRPIIQLLSFPRSLRFPYGRQLGLPSSSERYWRTSGAEERSPDAYRDKPTEMPDERPHYRAYLLRLWQTTSNAQPVWRASLEDPHTGERLGFATLAQLVAFLEEQIRRTTLPEVESGYERR